MMICQLQPGFRLLQGEETGVLPRAILAPSNVETPT